MGGYFPGVPGFVAFAGIKFGGYYLAGVTLRKWQPVIAASALKMAATRTGLGILIGPPLTVGMLLVMSTLQHSHSATNSNGDAFVNIIAFAFVYVLRIFIWALVIHLFTKSFPLPSSTFWKYSALGAAWSCLLDLPGIGLALNAPGQIPVC
jgi:hypothetical protein